MPVPLPDLPAGNTTICLVIPDSPQWRQIYMGALVLLQQWWYYDTNSPDGAEDVIQRVMDCHYLTSENYEGCMELDCLDVQNCIENTPSIQDIINNISNGGNINEPQRESLYSQDVFDAPVGCDYDTLYGYCRALWTFINANNIDFLQIMAESSNKTEQLSELMSAIPIFGALPFDEVLGWIDNFTTYNLEAYESSITTEIEDDIVCDLMCIAINNECHITMDQVYNYMLERMGGYSALTLGATFAEMVIFMATGTYPTDRIVFIWTLLQLGLAFIATKFVGFIGIRPYQIQARAGIPDDAWEVLCDECAWIQTLVSNEDFSLMTAVAVPNADPTNCIGGFDVDFIDSCYVSNNAMEVVGLRVNLAIPDTAIITRIEFDVEWVALRTIGGMFFGLNTTATSNATGNSGTKTVVYDSLSYTDETIFFEALARANIADASYVRIVEIRVTGVGDNPF